MFRTSSSDASATLGLISPIRGVVAALALEDKALRCVVVRATAGGLELLNDKRFEIPNDFLEPEIHPRALRVNLLRRLNQALLPIKRTRLTAIGISSPGMIDTYQKSILDIPRPQWKFKDESASNLHLISFKSLLLDYVEPSQIIVDNDATMAAIGERWYRQSSKNEPPISLDSFAYIRAGIGVNGAALLNGRPWHGRYHPEMGHALVQKHPDDTFDDLGYACGIHLGQCIEGRVGSSRINSIAERKGRAFAADIFSYYIAQFCHNMALFIVPDNIVIGGNLIDSLGDGDAVIDSIGHYFRTFLNDYPKRSTYLDSNFITKASLAVADASWRGALASALDPFHPQRNATQATRG